jgi:hypothetical protein
LADPQSTISIRRTEFTQSLGDLTWTLTRSVPEVADKYSLTRCSTAIVLLVIPSISIYTCHWVRSRPSAIVRAIRMIFWPLWYHLTKTQPLSRKIAQNRIQIYLKTDSNSFNWQVWAVAASGFITDSCYIFTTNVILPPLAFFYWNKDYSNWHDTTTNSLAMASSLITQQVLLYLADKCIWTRYHGMECVIGFTLGSTLGAVLCSTKFGGSMSTAAPILA